MIYQELLYPMVWAVHQSMVRDFKWAHNFLATCPSKHFTWKFTLCVVLNQNVCPHASWYQCQWQSSDIKIEHELDSTLKWAIYKFDFWLSVPGLKTFLVRSIKSNHGLYSIIRKYLLRSIVPLGMPGDQKPHPGTAQLSKKIQIFLISEACLTIFINKIIWFAEVCDVTWCQTHPGRKT